MKALLVKISLILITILTGSCSIMHSLVGSGATEVLGMSSVAIVKDQYSVQFVECLGNASSQQVVAVLAVTNRGPNVNNIFIGGSDNSLAIDGFGITYKPYNSAGKQYSLPTNVTVRVLVDGIGPILPNVGMFRTLRVNIGSGRQSVAEFRNVPISWAN